MVEGGVGVPGDDRRYRRPHELDHDHAHQQGHREPPRPPGEPAQSAQHEQDGQPGEQDPRPERQDLHERRAPVQPEQVGHGEGGPSDGAQRGAQVGRDGTGPQPRSGARAVAVRGVDRAQLPGGAVIAAQSP